MAISLGTAARNAVCDTVADLLVLGGSLIIQTAGGVVLATFTLRAPAFGIASGGTATAIGFDGINPISALNPLIAVGAAPGGDAAAFRVTDSLDAHLFSGTVSLEGEGGDLVLDELGIGEGRQLNLTAFTLSAS